MLGILGGNDYNYINKNNCKFSRRLYISYLKVIFATSLFWILLDTFIIYNYLLDCFSTTNCNNISENKVDVISSSVLNGGDKYDTETKKTLEDLHDYDNRLEVYRTSKEFGKDGTAVEVPDELKEEAKRLFPINQFNLVVSDLILPNRSIPDLRSKECQNKVYPVESLPDTSVVIVFHNEAWSTLTRTLWSVINRSPRRLLREIILVDDMSERDFLGKKLEDYLSTLPVPIHLERMGKRSGLVRSRLRGVSIAKGETITFLDAHCECSPGWLEPLLYQVYLERNSVISPIIDVINDKTFEYRLVPDLLAGFDWKVNFDWVNPSESEKSRRINDSTIPFRTPTMAGGLLTIDRNFFYDIGSYDDQMNIWGGENLEMSFRLWQCGSQVLISPCSRVGHVFRDISPYSFPDGTDRTVFVNQMRAVEVWLGDHKKFYYKSNPASKDFPVGGLSERIALKNRLKCHDFKWYLTNVYADSPLPIDFFSVGHVQNIKNGVCIHISTDGSYKLTMNNCFFEVDRQVFSYSSNKTLMTLDKQCLSTTGLFGGYVGLVACTTPPTLEQIWHYHKDTFNLENVRHNKCLSVEMGDHDQEHILTLAFCDGSEELKWVLEEFDEEKYLKQIPHKISSE